MPTSLPQRGAAPVIELIGVSKTFATASGERVRALDNTNFAIKPGEFITVVGASGCGKTTLLRLIAGLERTSAGTIKVNGAHQLGPSEQIGIVFQDPTLLPWRTVMENVLLPVQVLKLDARTYRARASRCWRRWASRTSRTNTRMSCPAACASAWRSPAPWCMIRPCC